MNSMLSAPMAREDGARVPALAAGQVLDARMIETVLEFEEKSRARLAIRVRPAPHVAEAA